MDLYKQNVALKFQIYNSLFLTLPLKEIKSYGNYLPLFKSHCDEKLSQNQSPLEIVEDFLATYKTSEKEHWDFLFFIIQYIERQIVLVDALEDAAFHLINEVDAKGSLKNLIRKTHNKKQTALLLKTLQNFSLCLVLTAHPTQFYPNTILSLITDLTIAIQNNNLDEIRMLLNQLGRTPFFQRSKPLPYNEAINVIWYLENIFYVSIGQIINQIKTEFPEFDIHSLNNDPLIYLGFWPGGDRDGNPNVTIKTTEQVAQRLHRVILHCYYSDLRELRRRISFRNAFEKISKITTYVLRCLEGKEDWNLQQFKQDLFDLRTIIEQKHDGLFVSLLTQFIDRVLIFGSHFACLDIRQESSQIHRAFDYLRPFVHNQVIDFSDLLLTSFAQPQTPICIPQQKLTELKANDPVLYDTLFTFQSISNIQKEYGEKACHRYIVSLCHKDTDILQLMLIARWTVFADSSIPIDFIPLFETIDDLIVANKVMQNLYENPTYRSHLETRNNHQSVMMGFSDGTKDGGYLTANWRIYKAKEDLSKISKRFGIEILFFDGRGGPPARGGGNTHDFYTSLGSEIANKQIQLTIQGQTISSKFGTTLSARFNLEQLLTAGLRNRMQVKKEQELSSDNRELLETLSTIAQKAYLALRSHSDFLPYLEEISPLHYYFRTNITSRPVKRSTQDHDHEKRKTIEFDDLRAIPFVSSWAQLKQNIPGYYGLGTALEEIKKRGHFPEAREMYQNSLFFRTLIENSMQSMCKTCFPLTRYLKFDAKYKNFWQHLFEEYERTKKHVLELTGQPHLLASNPLILSSIQLRESIVLPLLVVQQYALMRLRDPKTTPQHQKILKTLVLRSLSGNINASRNSA